MSTLSKNKPLSYRQRDELRAQALENLVMLWAFKRPKPRKWAVDGIAPFGFPTILSADGGTGKSYLAIFLALCIALSQPFFGRRVRPGPVLLVDFELELDEQERRVWQVLQGMGREPDDPALVNRLYYYCTRESLGSQEAHHKIRCLIKEHGIVMTVLDSLTIGSIGADVSSSTDVIDIMHEVGTWGTSFILDHISKGAASGNASAATSFGSVFKRNLARSMWTLGRAPGGGLVMSQTKSNFGAPQEPIYYEMEISDEKACFRAVDVSDASMAGVARHLTAPDVTYMAIQTLYKETEAPVSKEQILSWRAENVEGEPIALGTVSNHLTILRKAGKVTSIDGLVTPVISEAADSNSDSDAWADDDSELDDSEGLEPSEELESAEEQESAEGLEPTEASESTEGQESAEDPEVQRVLQLFSSLAGLNQRSPVLSEDEPSAADENETSETDRRAA